MSNFFKSRKERILPSILAALAVVSVVLLEAPLEIYSANQMDLYCSLRDFYPYCLIIGLGLAALAFAVLYFVPKCLYRLFCPLAVALAFLLYLQWSYLNLQYNGLPGDALGGFTPSKTALIVNTVVWLVVLGLAVATAFFKTRNVVRMGCLILSVLVLGTQISGAMALSVTNRDLFRTREQRMRQDDPEYTSKVLYYDNFTSFSSSRNVFVFLVDRFDEDFAEAALKELPDIYNELDGFTWFQDNLAWFQGTYPSVAWMLTQTPYSGDMSRKEYLNTAYKRGNTPFDLLHEAGYTINLYSDVYDSYSDGYYLPDYIGNLISQKEAGKVSFKNKVLTAVKMIRVALYRSLPFAAKKLLGNVGSGVDSLYRKDLMYTTEMAGIQRKVSEGQFVLQGEKTFSFIHMHGFHSIFFEEHLKAGTDGSPSALAIAAQGSFSIINRYIQEMKRLGVYEDATIIITGDHGKAMAEEDPSDPFAPKLTAMFVKPSGSSGVPLKTSQAQVSHEDLWATVFKSEGLGGNTWAGMSVFDVPEDSDRVRKQYYYVGKRNVKGIDEYIYEITGPARTPTEMQVASYHHYEKYQGQ